MRIGEDDLYGILADRLAHTRTLVYTILLYSLASGGTATVTITPRTQPISETIAVTASTLSTRLDASAMTLPGKLIEAPFEATGSKPLPPSSSGGAHPITLAGTMNYDPSGGHADTHANTAPSATETMSAQPPMRARSPDRALSLPRSSFVPLEPAPSDARESVIVLRPEPPRLQY